MISATWIQTKTNQIRRDGADVKILWIKTLLILPLVSVQIQD